MNRRNDIRRIFSVFLLVFLLAGTALAGEHPRNVIIMIGDGMGITHLAFTRISSPDGQNRLNVDSMPYSGFARTYSANSSITDSAAAATALATGYKTNNGMLGILPNGDIVPTILELLQKRGMAVGLITTCPITDATPAGFAAHVNSRTEQPEIASQYIKAHVDLLMGGGRSQFLPDTAKNSSRKDGRDIMLEAGSAGYDVVQTRDALLASKSSKILGLFENGYMTTESPEPSLAEMAGKALDVLSTDKKGFFLMVEGGQIDTESHKNNTAGMLKQTRDFNEAIGRVLSFVRSHRDTLLIVTADHETGGLTICLPTVGTNDRFVARWATVSHTAVDVPVFAEGPGAGSFSGLMNNIEIPKRIARIFGIKDFASQKAVALSSSEHR